MLRCLLAKATLDQEVNEASARDVWEKILELAKGLKDERWQARAEAELGFIAFLDGDVNKATGLLKKALVSLYLHGDLAAAIAYGSLVGNGQVEVLRGSRNPDQKGEQPPHASLEKASARYSQTPISRPHPGTTGDQDGTLR